ncbi:hypothetical protein AB835_06745 [Candidatus Endobugula sertula]|uniref:Prenyltransferase n=1 Tax=Candidatus Endobugula sertula TaxID=62101 RepID=A0A1D2QQH6_9GAMM|nr:hypothetical protein AB835_06745 [Candidatus Endobugula sertula]
MYQRLNVYFKEMFPLQRFIPYAAITFLGLYFSTQAVLGVDVFIIGYPTVIGFITLFPLSLLMRIFDEFKDLEVDRVLFPHRAVARGAVHTSDLKWLGICLVILMIILNISLDWVIMFFIAALAFGFLTFKWFFIKDILSHNLLLALVTHQPMGLLVNAYVAAIAMFVTANALGTFDTWVAAVVFAYFFPVTAWEIARKIRAPEQETEYVTYSKILGPRFACCLPLLFTSLSGILLLLINARLHLALWATLVDWSDFTHLYLHLPAFYCHLNTRDQYY